MASNTFGSLFTFTTWGESHGPAIGVVVDGCPAGIPLSPELINRDLARRAPGKAPGTSPRKESDTAAILSGVFEGATTGAPISIVIANEDADSSKYSAIAGLMRPGHANFTYLAKYGIFDHRGGGRASARETAARVAAGAVARQLLGKRGITVAAYLSAVGASCAPDYLPERAEAAIAHASASPIHAPCLEAQEAFLRRIAEAYERGDSVGGVVSFIAQGLPPGLGDPVYKKLPALLAGAMLGIPACKGFEIGQGFAGAMLCGSECNDSFTSRTDPGRKALITPAGNRAGGTLGGISTGLPLYGRAAFKPTSAIFLPQASVDLDGNPAEFRLPEGSRHDPCVAVRAVPVVEAMCLAVLADALLMAGNSRV